LCTPELKTANETFGRLGQSTAWQRVLLSLREANKNKPMSGAETREIAAVRPIVLCHLESLICLPAINLAFAALGDQIGLVILSRRFGAKHGGLLAQLVRNVRRSGWRLTFWLGFDIISAQIISQVAPWIAWLTGRQPHLMSVRALAARCGALVVDAGDINSAEIIKVTQAYNPDFVIVMNFDQILKPPLISVARLGVINVHPSLLPSFRGPCPVFWALAEKAAKFGVSIHLIEDGAIDAGPVVDHKVASLDPSLSVAEITSRLFAIGAQLIRPLLGKMMAGERQSYPQRPSEGDYRGFPDYEQVTKAAKQGVRLWRTSHVLHLIAAAIGLSRQVEAESRSSPFGHG
jgi:methionyl-tRNA formyltransferase